MSDCSLELARRMLSSQATKLSPSAPFTWTSGARMPVYNDNRVLLGSYTSRALVSRAFREKLNSLNVSCEVIAGTATAGIAPATSLADLMELPLAYVRSEAKKHGMGKRIEGPLTTGQKVVLVEDLVSTGGSAISAIEAIREAGGVIDICLSIFNYGFPEAEAAFAKINCQIISLLTFNTLCQVAFEEGYISTDEHKLIADWASSPFDWATRHGI
ncbi:MAG: orotate phosphoribosyltransferase [bacterium]|nr:orotate phosphoribosyltransferase [bacterium]